MAGRRGVAHTSDMVTIIYPQGCREVRFDFFCNVVADPQKILSKRLGHFLLLSNLLLRFDEFLFSFDNFNI